MSGEVVEKLKKTKSVEEVLDIVKGYGAEVTLEQAQELFDQFHEQGELSDDELTAVAGGEYASAYVKDVGYVLYEKDRKSAECTATCFWCGVDQKSAAAKSPCTFFLSRGVHSWVYSGSC